jgi:hypothetical protein
MSATPSLGRRAGLLWLLTTVTGGFGLFYVRSRVIVPGDAAATAANILASEPLYRAAIVSSLVSQVLVFFLGLTLFELFNEVNKRLATVVLASVLMSVGIAVVNMLNHFGALLILSRPDFLKVFAPAQLDAMALVLLRLANGPGQGLLEIFWAPYYVSFGLLVIRSRFLPKALGVLLVLMGAGFAINILQKFLIPQLSPAMFTQLAMTLGALGGIPTMLWLLIKGANTPRAVLQEPRTGR